MIAHVKRSMNTWEPWMPYRINNELYQSKECTSAIKLGRKKKEGDADYPVWCLNEPETVAVLTMRKKRK